MIRTTANKYGNKKSDSWKDSQATSVGSPSRIIKTTANMQGMKQDGVTSGAYSSQLPKGRPIRTGEGKLIETSGYGKATKLA